MTPNFSMVVYLLVNHPHLCVFSTDCLMDQKLTSFHLEILTKSYRHQDKHHINSIKGDKIASDSSLACFGSTYFELFLYRRPQLGDLGLDALWELCVISIEIPQQTAERVCEDKRKKLFI